MGQQSAWGDCGGTGGRGVNHLLYRWIDNRGRIPAWVRWVYPHAHFCPEMDGLLILTKQDKRNNCFCR